MKRQTLARISTICFLLTFVLLLTGCATTWVGEAVSIINVLMPAITAALGLATAFGAKLQPNDLLLVTKIASEATNDLQNIVKPLIEQYNTATAADQPGILEKIEAAVAVIVNNFATIAPALHIADAATKAKIEAVLTAIEAELTDLLEVIPVIQGKKAMGDITPPLSAGQFKKAFNRAMLAKTGDHFVDDVAKQFTLR